MKVFNQVFQKIKNNNKLNHPKKEILYRINFNKRHKAHKEREGIRRQNKMHLHKVQATVWICVMIKKLVYMEKDSRREIYFNSTHRILQINYCNCKI